MLKITHNEVENHSWPIENLSNSLYIMQGIQRFTKHGKSAGKGLSFSVIFRQLIPFNGQLHADIKYNERVPIDWQNASIPRAWQNNNSMLQQQVGATYDLREFNRRRLHPVHRCSVSSRGGFATSIILHKYNSVSPCGTKVWFVGWPTDKKSKSLNNRLLATRGISQIAIYKKLSGKMIFLGNFFVTEVRELNKRLYFELQKYE